MGHQKLRTQYSAPRCQCNKRMFASKTEARDWARTRTDRDRVTWNAYKCPFWAKVWHIGHLRGTPPPTREISRHQVAVRKERLAGDKEDKSELNS